MEMKVVECSKSEDNIIFQTLQRYNGGDVTYWAWGGHLRLTIKINHREMAAHGCASLQIYEQS